MHVRHTKSILCKQDAADTTRTTTGVTGGPHLFVKHVNGTTTFQTCESEGEQLYLRNPFIVIRGTNTHLNSGGSGLGGRITTLTQVATIRTAINLTDLIKVPRENLERSTDAVFIINNPFIH